MNARLRTIRSRTSLGVLLCLSGACGRGDDPRGGTVTSLLERAPDERIEEPGTLRPHPELQWEGRGGSGWRRETRRLEDGRPYALGNTIEVELTLPVTGPDRARTLRFEAWITAPGDEEERGVGTVHLNDQPVGEIRLSTRPRTHTLPVAAELWVPGDNQLSIHVPPMVYRQPGDFLGVGTLVYGEERLIERDPASGGLRLPPGTGVRYRLLPLPGAEIAMAGRGSGAARMTVRLFDPLTSRSLATLGPLTAPTEAGRLQAALPLPSGEDRLVEVELTWSAEASEPLVLERLELLEARARPRPPIVLVSIDTLSARHLSLYGYPRKTSPNLDAFANEPGAVVFERCRANAPWTSPSYVSLFTGLYPTSVSMDLGSDDSRFLAKLPEGRLTLAEVLHACGYRTAGFIDALHLDERFGFAQGFEHFDFSAGERPLTDPDGGIRHILPRALEWIDGLEAEHPFFLFLHAYDVHGPYLPPPPFAGRFEDDALAEAGRELVTGTLPHTFLAVPEYISSAWPTTPTPPYLPIGPFRSAYDEGILTMDETLGQLFDALEERGILDEALVIVTADHGESLDDHDYVGHGLLYEEVLRVPLVVRLPRAWRTQETPRRVPDTVQLADVLPTLLDLVAAPELGSKLHGRSFAPLLFGEELAPAPTFSEGGAMRQAAIELGGWKLIESRPGTDSLPWTMLTNPRLSRAWVREHVPELVDLPLTSANFQRVMQREDEDVLALLEALRAELDETVIELYDLDSDPEERVDLSGEEPEKVAELLRHLRRAQALREEARRAVEEALVPLSAEDLEELQKLGYVEGG